MSQLKKVALVAVFFLGCAAEHVVVPAAHAGTSPTRWEYACRFIGYDEITQTANTFGTEGWELAVASGPPGNPVWCFKRALP